MLTQGNNVRLKNIGWMLDSSEKQWYSMVYYKVAVHFERCFQFYTLQPIYHWKDYEIH